MKLYLYIFIFIFSACTLHGEPRRIHMDGIFQDWNGLTPLFEDAAGDQGESNIDFGRIWVTNDERYLYLRIELGEEINLQDLNDVALYLDTDNNAGSGLSIYGLGAEMRYIFGRREGLFITQGGETVVSQYDLGMHTAPTVTSDQFEIAIDRQAVPDDAQNLFTSNTILIRVADLGFVGDVIPNEDLPPLSYTFQISNLDPVSATAVQKNDSGNIRIVSYNVLFSGIYETGRSPSFTRIFNALQGDIIGLVEMYDYSASHTLDRLMAINALSEEYTWQAEKQGPDAIAVTRFNIAASVEVEGNGLFLLDLRPEYQSDLLLIVAHPPCCANNSGRQFEIDAIMAEIRDLKAGTGSFTLAEGTPMVLIGDLNLVGDAQQLATALTGEIINTGTFGSGAAPDWDNSPFTDAIPRHISSFKYFTWYQDGSSFGPGRLDFVIYSDNRLDLQQTYTLFTPDMHTDSLSVQGLHANDVLIASDHLPLVADFTIRDITSLGYQTDSRLLDKAKLSSYPNPFNSSVKLSLSQQASGSGELSIFDLAGKKIKTIFRGYVQAGRRDFSWDAANYSGQLVSSGIYIARFMSQGRFWQKKMLLLK